MKEIVHILSSLRGSMWEVSLETQRIAQPVLPRTPYSVCVCLKVSLHTRLSTDTTFRGINPVY